MLSPRRMDEIMADLAGIEHVKIVRLHHRACPWPSPARISDEMVAALKAEGRDHLGRGHANRARELTGAARAALRAARRCRDSAW